MDLYAHSQIDELEEKIEAQGIVVPRLRGYRLMSQETPITEEQRLVAKRSRYYDNLRCLIAYGWKLDSIYTVTIKEEEKISKYADIDFENYEVKSIYWNKIHGKKRKALKYMNKVSDREVDANLDMFNKYAGKKDVLYIHARIGGIDCKNDTTNWMYYNGDEIIKKQPWFLDAVDDLYDSTYCDIYAKIDEDVLLGNSN